MLVDNEIFELINNIDPISHFYRILLTRRLRYAYARVVVVVVAVGLVVVLDVPLLVPEPEVVVVVVVGLRGVNVRGDWRPPCPRREAPIVLDLLLLTAITITSTTTSGFGRSRS